jgi:DNA-binding PadR family transcriptional regulator
VADLSITEYAVLGLLAESPSHGFALARQLEVAEDLGRIYTVRRPLVYRALDRLVDRGLAQPDHVERGDSGPIRVIHHVTDEGRRELSEWLSRPVDHVRDMRIGFLLKVALLLRSGRSPASLVDAQRSSLESTLDALDRAPDDDHVEIWRKQAARTAADYLEELAQVYD